MDNVYKRYLKERERLELIDCGIGFIGFRMEKDHCFISDYYVIPEERRSGVGYWLADQVLLQCRKYGVAMVMCQSDAASEGHDVARKSILNYGFKEFNREGNIYHYFLEVGKWERR